MDWNDVVDRKGTFEFIGIGVILSSLYLPEDIQALIDTHGVREMVKTVNQNYQHTYKRFALQITNNGGDLKVVQA